MVKLQWPITNNRRMNNKQVIKILKLNNRKNNFLYFKDLNEEGDSVESVQEPKCTKKVFAKNPMPPRKPKPAKEPYIRKHINV